MQGKITQYTYIHGKNSQYHCVNLNWTLKNGEIDV